ncbi:MAG: serine/threonine protein kinase [Myxococcales bacterium]|nr:serine/threonine protein kinase [Myxococcales bacterium]
MTKGIADPSDRDPRRGEDRSDRGFVRKSVVEPRNRDGRRLRRNGPNTRELESLRSGDLSAQLLVAGRYRLLRRLGRGGMATVFLAQEIESGREVAVKILSGRHPDRQQAVARFLREARLSARIHHENVVEVFDSGSTAEGVVYLVMEVLVGEDLRETIARHPTGLPWSRVRSLMLQICAGLTAAHQAGVVHRDLKPSNCFRVPARGQGKAEREQIKLVDFGIATTFGSGLGSTRAEEERRLGERITGEGTIIGTPEYMSREQARGDEVDARSDVYAAGVIMGELLTGKVPFTGKSKTAVIAAQIYEQPSTLQAMAAPGVTIDARVEAIYARALAKDPGERFADIDALAAAIAAVPADGALSISGCFAALDQARDAGAAHPSESATHPIGPVIGARDDAPRHAAAGALASWWRRSWRLVAAMSL